MPLICWIKAGEGRWASDRFRSDGIEDSRYGDGQVTSHDEIHNYREIAVRARDEEHIAGYTSSDLSCDPSAAASFYVLGSNCRTGRPFSSFFAQPGDCN